MVNEETVQAAWIERLKAMPDLTAEMIGVSGTEIREAQWQGSDFSYPAVRVYADVFPSINGCGPDTAEVCVELYTDQKSSLKIKHMSGILINNLHKKRFKSTNGLHFVMIAVTKSTHAERSIAAWGNKVMFNTLVDDGVAYHV